MECEGEGVLAWGVGVRLGEREVLSESFGRLGSLSKEVRIASFGLLLVSPL